MNGRVIELPKGSTPLDFAYEISSSLGNHCAKAKVNASVVPLDYELRTGDKVMIQKKMEMMPNLYWLSIVKTEKAKQAIQKFLLEKGQDTLLKEGVRLLNQQLRARKMPLFDESYQALKTFKGKPLSLEERKALLISLAQGEIQAGELMKELFPEQKKEAQVSFRTRSNQKEKISIGGDSNLTTKIAACCSPAPGHSIVGYVTRGGFISVHKKSCKVLKSLDARRHIEAHWSHLPRESRRILTEVLVQESSLLSQLSRVLQKKKISLLGFEHRQQHNGVLLNFELQLPEEEKTETLLKLWREQAGVLTVTLIEQD